MRHLDNNKVTYFEHWKRAIKISIALTIHAFIPNCFETYASDQLNKH